MRLSTSVVLSVVVSCCEALTSGALFIQRAAIPATTTLPTSRYGSSFGTVRACASPTAEELLLEALGSMKDKDMQKAKALISKAQQLCDANGGPSEEQAALLQMLTSRLPPDDFKVAEKEPSLAEMFPGTTAAPTGKSLVLPGTPSIAD